MLRLYGGLAERYAASFVAAALAALSLACIAAWSEGRVPRWALLWTFVPNVAANIAAAWTITRWRAEGGDVAVSSLGHSPTQLWLFVIVLALPIVGWTPVPTSTPDTPQLVLSPNTVSLRTADGETRYSWHDGNVTRTDPQGHASTHGSFPPPKRASVPRVASSGVLPMALKCLMTALALAWLGFKRSRPGLSATLCACTASIAGGIAVDQAVKSWLI